MHDENDVSAADVTKSTAFFDDGGVCAVLVGCVAVLRLQLFGFHHNQNEVNP
jgi:hypothetical protein